MLSLQKLDYVELNPEGDIDSTVILLHGLGADGHDFVDIIPELNLPESANIRFVFPHAPLMPVTVNGGSKTNAWYDVLGYSKNSPQDEKGIRHSQSLIDRLLSHEQYLGVPAEKIILAGFSQGGAMALHCGLRYPKKLAGILALSTYLPIADFLTDESHSANQETSILMAHGKQDPVIPVRWGEISKKYLTKLGYPVQLNKYQMEHHVCPDEMKDISDWLQARLLLEK